jgi:predicted Zn-dependent peptidase
MTDIFAEVERDGITEEELTAAKSKVKARVVLGSERPRSRLFAVGGNWASQHAYRTVQDDLHDVDAVTIEAVRDLLARYPLTTNATIAIGPLSELDAPRIR